MSGSSSAAAGAAGGAARPPAGRNPQADRITFPEDVPEAVKKPIISYQPPPQRQIVPLESGKATRSITAFYGDKLEILPRVVGPHRRPMEWACLASIKCRNERKRLKIFSDATTGATSHLKDMHHIVGAASAKTAKRKREQLATKEVILESAVYKDDPSRYN
ncbi:unnamed protein product, partial [Ectocarpus sp. 12 AP-2014]